MKYHTPYHLAARLMICSVIFAGVAFFAAPMHSEGEAIPLSFIDAFEPLDQTRASLVQALGSKAGATLSPFRRAELAEAVANAAAESGMDAFLVLAVISVESEFKTMARSRRGAMGLMQLRNATAFEYSDKAGVPMAELGLFDEATNIALGSAYLRACHDHLGSWQLALAAYNWGPAKVHHALHETHGKLPNTMRAYEVRVGRRYQQFLQAAGIDLAARPLPYGPSRVRDAI